MNRSAFNFVIVLVLVLFISSCEERIDLGVTFPHQSEKLFCELIGYPGFGFIGLATPIIGAQETDIPIDNVHIKIWEEGTLIIDEMSQTPSLFYAYDVKSHFKYNLEINYKDQLIKGQTSQTVLPSLTIENLQATNDYIDSLGIYVTSLSFNFQPTGLQDTFYQVYNSTLLENNTPVLDITNYSTPKEMTPQSTTNYISKRLPNIYNYGYLQVNNFTIDRTLFQYLKNIKYLNQIPNDNIEGHHGNLTNGVGYFGLVNYSRGYLEL